MKLLTEVTAIGRDLQIGESTENGKKRLFIEGPFVMCDAVNRNQRRYRKKEVMLASVAQYVKDYVEERRAIGETKHPDYPFPDITKASILTKSLVWDGSNAIGKAQILDNIEGQNVRALLEADFNMGVSTRGLGDTIRTPQGFEDVVEGYLMTATDVVDRPSGQVCYTKALRESVEWKYDEEKGVYIPLSTIGSEVDKVVKKLDPLTESEFVRKFKLALEKLG